MIFAITPSGSRIEKLIAPGPMGNRMPLHLGHEPRKEVQLRRCDVGVIDHRSKRIATVDRVDCCQFACVLAYDLSNLPQHGSPFEWMNVSPKPKAPLGGCDDRPDIRR